MRKVTYSVATSVDGFIAGAAEAMDWLRWSEDASQLNAAAWEGVDTILIGRKTLEFAIRGGGSFGSLTTYVFSRSIDETPKGTEVIRDDAVGFVQKLKTEPGGRIMLMGGGELASALVDGGVIDEIALNVHPVLFGDGTPLIARLGQRVEMELVETRVLQMGCILARYRIQS